MQLNLQLIGQSKYRMWAGDALMKREIFILVLVEMSKRTLNVLRRDDNPILPTAEEPSAPRREAGTARGLTARAALGEPTTEWNIFLSGARDE